MHDMGVKLGKPKKYPMTLTIWNQILKMILHCGTSIYLLPEMVIPVYAISISYMDARVKCPCKPQVVASEVGNGLKDTPFNRQLII